MTSDLHPLVAAGFAAAGDAYDAARPDFPPTVVAALDLPAGARVLDLAAGTGKLTRTLRAGGHPVVAVEPLAGMRSRIEAEEVLDGAAEAIPLADASVAAVTVGDAWHWFDPERAAAEVARVLRPGGVVALLWQYPMPPGDGSTWFPLVGAAVSRLLAAHPAFVADQGRGALAAHPAFGPLEERTVEHRRETDAAGVLAYLSTLSPVAAMAPSERAEFLGPLAGALPPGPIEQRFLVRIHRAVRDAGA